MLRGSLVARGLKATDVAAGGRARAIVLTVLTRRSVDGRNFRLTFCLC